MSCFENVNHYSLKNWELVQHNDKYNVLLQNKREKSIRVTCVCINKVAPPSCFDPLEECVVLFLELVNCQVHLYGQWSKACQIFCNSLCHPKSGWHLDSAKLTPIKRPMYIRSHKSVFDLDWVKLKTFLRQIDPKYVCTHGFLEH